MNLSPTLPIYAALATDVQPPTTQQLIHSLAGLLPLQGPITAFAFLNPLQELEHLSFVEALRNVKQTFGCEPFLQEGEYRKKLATGRISLDDLKHILAEESPSQNDCKIAGLVSLPELRISMLQHSINLSTEHEVLWVIAESDALVRFRSEIEHSAREHLIESTKRWVLNELQQPDAHQSGLTRQELLEAVARVAPGTTAANAELLADSDWEAISLRLIWDIVHMRMECTPAAAPHDLLQVRHRDLLQAATQHDSDALVHEVLIRFCAAYLDQGYAHWRLPDRDAGFFQSFLQLYSTGGVLSQPWLRPVKAEAERLLRNQTTALESIEESLQLLGVTADEREAFLRGTLLALPGWAGMIWQTEVRPDRVFVPSPAGTLEQYLAARLLLERYALQWLARDTLGSRGTLSQLRTYLHALVPEHEASATANQRAYPILQLAQLHGWSPIRLAQLAEGQWNALVAAIEGFSNFERRRLFHLAFERQLARRTLDTIAQRAGQPHRRPQVPKLQVVTCIDAREESFRRHLEEVNPDVETFGQAGFFCIPMYFRGAGEAHFAALCPIVIKPKHWVVEEVVHTLADSERQRAWARRFVGQVTHNFNNGTRGSLMGALLTTALGPLFTAPLVGRILFPRLTARMHRTARGLVAPPPITRLRLERADGTLPSTDEGGIGFTLAEMVAMGEKLLRDIGLTSDFARLVLILGHGSQCMNNPHESAYHCGACSGSAGSPNARAAAFILNDPRVRRILAERGLNIPEETYFLGGMHNTATEAISYFDLELLPPSHFHDLREARDILARVSERNAHERCRRFQSAPLDLSPEEALQHVQDRSDDLSQTRPEYGNATNAVCFVGRRSRIRGIYLDRRSFLMSYDPTQDDADSAILARILAAVIPVCEGINLLYTMSAMDSRGWGSGTKLPHNITSLLGVMDGSASDLRPGIPWQGCDIHEPVRILFIIETTAAAMLKIMDDNPAIAKICRNQWSQLAVLDPRTNRLQTFVNGCFVDYEPSKADVPASESSLAWYRGQRDNVNFAIIGTPISSESTSVCAIEPACEASQSAVVACCVPS